MNTGTHWLDSRNTARPPAVRVGAWFVAVVILVNVVFLCWLGPKFYRLLRQTRAATGEVGRP